MDTFVQIRDFHRIDLRVGTVLKVESNPKAKNPAYVLHIDFGDDLGIKKSSAQITGEYSQDALLKRQVVAVTNFPPRNVAGVVSEVLVLAAVEKSGRTILLEPSSKVLNGSRVF